MPTSSLFTRPRFWVCFAFLSFLFLPVQALDYGLLGATAQEWRNAMGWSNLNLSLCWFLPLVFYFFPISSPTQHRWALFGILSWFGFIFISAYLAQIRLGYAVLGLIISLIGLATQSLAALNIMRGDRTLIASLLSLLLLIGAFILYPTLSIFIEMISDHSDTNSHTFFTLISQPYILKIIGNSLSVAVSVGILSSLFGLLFALYTTRIGKHTQFISKFFSILPIVTPPFVVGLGISLMLGRTGYVTDFLVAHFGVSRDWLYGFTGITLSHTLALTPMSFMILSGALQSLNPALEEMAYSLKANRYQVFFSMVLPLLKPALANSFLVVIIQSLADFSTPFVLGGNFDVIATQLYFSVAGSQLDYPLASQLGGILLLFSLAVFIVQYHWIGKNSYITVSGKMSRSNIQALPKAIEWGISISLVGWALFNLALYGSILYGSFTKNWGIDYSLTLDNYRYLFGQGIDHGAFPSLIQTLLFALISAPITAVLGLLLAYLLARCHFRGKKSLEFITLLCFAVPGTVAGLSYVLAFNNAPVYLMGTSAIIILSMITRNLPLGLRASLAGLKQLDHTLDEASLSLKANRLSTLRWVIFPLLSPAFLSALVTSFVRAMTTVSAIIFLVNAETRVATSYILNRVEDGEYGLAVAYGATLIVVMMAIILFADGVLSNVMKRKSQR